ncbi:MAG: cell division protein FtsZ, partial [Sphaerochaetaceae bacterium]
GAKSVLVNLSGSENLTLQEYEDVVELITQNCDENALIIAGQAFNPELGDRIKVTVVATGFEHKEEVVGSEADTISASKRFAIPTNPASAASASLQKPADGAAAKTTIQQNPAGTIQINRWQDLQKQIGKGTQGPGGDFSIPAVLRYGEHDTPSEQGPNDGA